MTFVVHYALKAKPDSATELRTSLDALRAIVIGLPGNAGVELLQDVDQPGDFHFIERWETEARYAAASKLIPPTAFNQMKNALGAAPMVSKLKPLPHDLQ